jgi:chromosomal replication initiation ATPase DnaA
VITTQQIMEEVGKRFMVTPEHLRGPRRGKAIAQARMIGYLLAHEFCGHLTLIQIARQFGRSDHSVVISGIETVCKAMQADKWLKASYEELRREFRGYPRNASDTPDSLPSRLSLALRA